MGYKMIIIDVVDDGDMNMMMMTKNKDDLDPACLPEKSSCFSRLKLF